MIEEIYYVVVNDAGDYYYRSVGWRNDRLQPYYLIRRMYEAEQVAESLTRHGTNATVKEVILTIKD